MVSLSERGAFQEERHCHMKPSQHDSQSPKAAIKVLWNAWIAFHVPDLLTALRCSS